jgi:hypothetical protein
LINLGCVLCCARHETCRLVQGSFWQIHNELWSPSEWKWVRRVRPGRRRALCNPKTHPRLQKGDREWTPGSEWGFSHFTSFPCEIRARLCEPWTCVWSLTQWEQSWNWGEDTDLQTWPYAHVAFDTHGPHFMWLRSCVLWPHALKFWA